jgi:hypothetical protein
MSTADPITSMLQIMRQIVEGSRTALADLQGRVTGELENAAAVLIDFHGRPHALPRTVQ